MLGHVSLKLDKAAGRYSHFIFVSANFEEKKSELCYQLLGVLQLHEAGRGFLTQCGLQCQNNEKRRQNDIFLCMIFFLQK